MKQKFLSVMVACACATALLAQTPQKLPIDSAVRYGVLENGLTYYIRHNEQPKQRAEFHIAQAVGAILEEDHQNGLAHFLEHMAFNGTEHFPGKSIINYFESIGVNFGGNINAYTSLDETVYRLSDVPTYREGIIDSALLVLHDWSCALSLLGDEIDAERGVIREEWRTGATANRRMWKASNEKKYPGSQYAKRDVIGDTAVINNFAYDALRDYYKKWYGPDLQAIVVVGDIDVDAIEAKIKALWADVPARSNRGERPYYEVGQNIAPIVSIVTDKEARQTQIQLEYKHPAIPFALRGTDMHYMVCVMNNLVENMLSTRFDEITQKPDASFVGAYAGVGDITKTEDRFVFIVIPKEGQEKQALRDILTEAERMRRYGFTTSELELAKTDELADCEKNYNDRDNRKNYALTREYIRHYLDGECIPGIAFEYDFLKTVLPQLSVEVINQVAQKYITDENLIIAFSAPKKESVVLPDEAETIDILNEVKASEIEAPKEETLDQPLVKKTPKASKIVKTTRNESLGTTEWTLKNGAKIVIKPTTFKKDEILFSAYSKGGLSYVDDADLYSAAIASQIVDNNGLGEFSSIQLQKLLTGKIADVSTVISSDSEKLSGHSSVKDFETLLQLIYLQFTSVRRDDEAFAALTSMYATVLTNRESNPKQIFMDSIQLTMSSHSPRTIILDVPAIERIEQEKALQIFKQRISNAADFTFFFVGNIDPDDKATQQLICTWIGGLKGNCKQLETAIDRGVRTPEGVTKNYFTRNMQVRTASNRICYVGNMDYTLANRVNMRAIGDILDIRYLESIREREGGSYGVGVAGQLMNYPTPTACLLMQFDTDPEKQEKLIGIIHEEVQTILENGPRADDLHKVKSSMLKDFDEDIEDNNHWLNTILFRNYIEGVDYTTEYTKAVEAITPESIVATLKALISQNNVVEVVMLPAE